MKNKIAVITGGGSGIGAGIGIEFAGRGATVIVADIDGGKAEQTLARIRKFSPESAAVELDVTSAAMTDTAARNIAGRFGRLDIWVNCAGVSYITPFLECTEEVWDRTIDINLKGTFNGCKAAIRHMLPNKSGNIINMASQSGKTGSSHYAAYCASKFGIIGLTQSLAVEFARDNIRVNALCPGVVLTPMWDRMTADYAAKRNLRPEEVKPYFENKIPLGRLCGIADVAKAAVFLAGDDAAYLTGQSLNISGGTIMH